MVALAMLRFSLFSASLLASAVLATPAPSILTPLGARSSSDLHLIPEGGQVLHVDGEIHLVDASGAVVHVAINDDESVKDKRYKLPPPTNSDVTPLSADTIASAEWYSYGGSPISLFTTTYTVPQPPKKDNGQTLFLSNSLEPANGNAVLQPVLQYGPSAAGGGSYWSVASWYLVGSQAYYTNPVRVYPGQTLNGVIFLSGTRGNGRYNYAASFAGLPQTTVFAGATNKLVRATESLESYGADKPKEYPTGSTVFRNIAIRTLSGRPYVRWQTDNDNDDGITAQVNSQGATNARITIDY